MPISARNHKANRHPFLSFFGTFNELWAVVFMELICQTANSASIKILSTIHQEIKP